MPKGLNIKNMIGERSGRLVVIKRGPNKADGSAQWLSRCDCGNDKMVLLPGNNIRNKRTKSCGCLQRDHALELQANPTESLLAYWKRGTPMAMCHPSRPQEAKGLCGPCYNKLKQTYNPERDKRVRAMREAKLDKFTLDTSPFWRRSIKHLYNITPEYYLLMFAKQNGLCACCGNPEVVIEYRNGKLKRLQVDHDHLCCPGKRSCGKCIRGLICSACNMVLGRVKDNPQHLMKLADYILAGGAEGLATIENEVEQCIGGGC